MCAALQVTIAVVITEYNKSWKENQDYKRDTAAIVAVLRDSLADFVDDAPSEVDLQDVDVDNDGGGISAATSERGADVAAAGVQDPAFSADSPSSLAAEEDAVDETAPALHHGAPHPNAPHVTSSPIVLNACIDATPPQAPAVPALTPLPAPSHVATDSPQFFIAELREAYLQTLRLEPRMFSRPATDGSVVKKVIDWTRSAVEKAYSFVPGPPAPLQRAAATLVNHAYFDHCMIAVIVANAIVLSMPYEGMSEAYEHNLDYADWAFVCFFGGSRCTLPDVAERPVVSLYHFLFLCSCGDADSHNRDGNPWLLDDPGIHF